MPKKRRSRLMKSLLISVVLAFIATISIYFGLSQNVRLQEGIKALNDWLPSIAKVASPSSSSSHDSSEVAYMFAIVSDSHEDIMVYPQIIANIASRQDLTFVVHLGDQSNAGEKQKLIESKNILDTISAPVYVLPGDHDSNWVPRRDLTNFKQVYNLKQTSFSINKDSEKYIFIDNSDGSAGISEESWNWLSSELEASKNYNLYVFMSTPLSNPYLNFKTMGSQSESVKKQAKELGQLLSSYKVRAIFAGDAHTFSQYKDELTDIPIVTVGAAGTNKNPLPMYVLVEILSDGGYNVTSVPLKQ